MSTRKLSAVVSHALVFATLFTGCSPMVRPMVQDGVGTALPLRNEVVSAVTLVAEPALFTTPVDSSPDPDGKIIYFTASGPTGAGLFRVPAAGGTVEAVAVGSPFQSPMGLAVSSDGAQVVVADTAADQLILVATADGTATPLTGSQHTAPRGVEVKNEAGAEMVYFSGTDASDGQPAVWKIALAGGEATVVAKGAPLVEPMGVAIANDGAVYVADRSASGNGLGSVFRVLAGKVEAVAENFRTGNFAGVTLTLDGSVLLASALDAQRDSAQVLLIELGTGTKGMITKGVAQNSGSGGVHRAYNVNIFSWADYRGKGGGGGGGVHRIDV